MGLDFILFLRMRSPSVLARNLLLAKSSHFTIVLLKACSTAWDAEDRLCGVTDLPASEDSQSKVSTIVHETPELTSLRNQMSVVWSGPSDVSSESVQLLVNSADTKAKSFEAFSELNLGLWEGVLRSDLEERFPSVYSQWIDHPGTVAPPDGESLEAVQERVLEQLFKGLLKLRSDHPVVGLVLRPYAWAVLKCWLDQKPLSEVWGYLEEKSSIESFSLNRSTVESYRTQKTKIA